jgi:hypothetical protein
MNAKQRYRAKRSAQYHAEQRERLAGMQEELGCSSRVANAISGPALRGKECSIEYFRRLYGDSFWLRN